MDRPSGQRNHIATKQHAGLSALIAGAVLALSAILPLPDTAGRILHLPSICLFNQLTGLPCPACGLTRAFVLLSHGEWRQSLAFHPMGWLAYAAFVLLCIDGLPMFLNARRTPLFPRAIRTRILWTCAAVTLGAGLIRLVLLIAADRH